MSESVIFKSQAFGGFNKEEVLNFFDKLNAEHSEELNNVQSLSAQLNEELKEERLHREESESSFAELMTAYEELRQHYLMLKEQNDNLGRDKEKLLDRAETAEKELEIAREQNSQWEERFEASERELEAVREQSSQWEERSEASERELEATRAQNSQWEEKLEASERELEAAREQNSQWEEKLEVAERELEAAREQNSQWEGKLAAAERELETAREQNFRLEEKMETERQKMEKQAEENRRLAIAANEVGDSAHQLLSGAKTGAESMLSDVKLSTESINNEIDAFCDELEKTKSFMQDSLAVLVQRLEYIKNTADASRVKTVDQNEKMEQLREKYERLISEADTKVEYFKKRFFQ